MVRHVRAQPGAKAFGHRVPTHSIQIGGVIEPQMLGDHIKVVVADPASGADEPAGERDGMASDVNSVQIQKRVRHREGGSLITVQECLGLGDPDRQDDRLRNEIRPGS
ncbi:MAG: hypothetical protein ABI353_07820 [Isosphaeraceae bacterium]